MVEVVCGRRVVSEREKILREIKGSIRRARKLRIGVGLEIVREPLRRFRIPGSIDTTRRGLCVRPRLLLWRSLLARVLWVWSMQDRKSTRLNSSHQIISYAVFCLKKKK